MNFAVAGGLRLTDIHNVLIRCSGMFFVRACSRKASSDINVDAQGIPAAPSGKLNHSSRKFDVKTSVMTPGNVVLTPLITSSSIE